MRFSCTRCHLAAHACPWAGFGNEEATNPNMVAPHPNRARRARTLQTPIEVYASDHSTTRAVAPRRRVATPTEIGSRTVTSLARDVACARKRSRRHKQHRHDGRPHRTHAVPLIRA